MITCILTFKIIFQKGSDFKFLQTHAVLVAREMRKQEDEKIAEETLESSPCPRTLWGTQKMQTSHSQHSVSASSLHKKVKELGQKTSLHCHAGIAAFPIPQVQTYRVKSLFVTDGTKEYSCTESSFLETHPSLQLN